MVRQIERRIKQRMDAVTDDFVDHAAMRDDDIRQHLEIAVEQGHEFARLGALGHRREAFNVGEHRGNVAGLAFHAQ